MAKLPRQIGATSPPATPYSDTSKLRPVTGMEESGLYLEVAVSGRLSIWGQVEVTMVTIHVHVYWTQSVVTIMIAFKCTGVQ